MILVVEPRKKPEVREISGSLEEMQSIVGGKIQIIYPFSEEVALVCNDEGKLLQMPPNRGLRTEDGEMYDIICGTFFLCAAPSDCDHLDSLTPEQAERYKQIFHVPELFVNIAGCIICLPLE